MHRSAPTPSETTVEPAYVITLVHGTWADTRGWVAPGSVLRRELEGRLGHLVFREFPWISANTHAARIEAGVRLGRFVRGGHAQYPRARHFIVAHSHGGTVALYAMRDAAASQAIAGVVTLATPFLHTRRRQCRGCINLVAFLLLAVPVVLGTLALMTPGLESLRIAWIAGGIGLTIATDSRLSKWLIDVVRRQQTDIIAALLPPPIDPSRLLILCSRGDEARGWLRTIDLAAQAPFVITAALLPLVGVLAKGPISRALSLDTRAEVIIAAAMVSMVLLVFSGFLRWPGYGREPLWTHLLVSIGTDRTPREVGGRAHTAFTFEVPRPSAREQSLRRRLRHKSICSTPTVVSALGDWIGVKRRESDGNSSSCLHTESPRLSQ